MSINKVTEKYLTIPLFSACQIESEGDKNFSFFTGCIDSSLSEKITHKTLFDLASLTKALFIAPVYYKLFYDKEISPLDTLDKFLPEMNHSIPVQDLLSHRSGFPAWLPFFEKERISQKNSKTEIIKRINETINDNLPVYSDLNFILLGFLLENLFKKNLNEIWSSFLNEISPSSKIIFNPKEKCVKTGFSKPRQKICDSEVEDDNCWYLFGKAGHSGLFSSAKDIVTYLKNLLSKEFFISNISEGIGFDRITLLPSNYGTKPNQNIRGHLGYTGTAFAIDIKKRNIAVLLTNRTHIKDDENSKRLIKEYRSAIFDELLN